MKEKSNNKYIIFPAFMLMITIGSYFYSYFHAVGTNQDILEKYDITGMTGICMTAMLIFEVVALIIAIIKGVKAKKDGVDYLFNKIFSMVFVVLAIIPILMFIVVRSNEEKLAQEVDGTLEQLKSLTVELPAKNTKKKSTSKKIENQLNQILEQRQNDKFYERKLEIAQEIEDNNSKFTRYLGLYFYNPIYNESSEIVVTPREEEQYYGIYSVYTVINAICIGFYFFMSLKDKDTNIRSKILDKI